MPKKPKDLAEEIVQEIIRIFAKREDPEHFKVIFSRVAGQKTITYSRDRRRYNNFLDTCQRRFFRRLSTNEDGWRIWHRKQRGSTVVSSIVGRLLRYEVERKS